MAQELVTMSAKELAVEWKVLPAMPCRVRRLKKAKAVVDFYEPEE